MRMLSVGTKREDASKAEFVVLVT